MSQFSDPYQPPSMSPSSAPTSSETETFQNIAFWQKFFSILCYVVGGLTMLGMLGNIALSAVQGGIAMLIGAMFLSLMAFAMVVAVYVIPAILLNAASQATKNFAEGRIGLGDYATNQKKLWRYLGIMVCIIMAINALLVVLAVLVLILAGASATWR